MKKTVNTIFFVRANKTKHGGAENYLHRLSELLTKKNINHEIINSIFPKFLPSWLRVILFNLQVCLFRDSKFYFSLERITCPDIYRAGDGVHKVFLKTQNKSRLNLLHPIYLFIEKQCFDNAKRIIANSKMIKKEIVDIYAIDPNKIDVIYNGINYKDMDSIQAFRKLSKEFKINKNQHFLLYVGSGFKRKGVEEFLQIVHNLKHLDLMAFVIGKEKNMRHYYALSKQLGIEDKIIFTGARDDVDDFYSISDIFILPTHYEPFSNVILEAMSFGNVVFTTKQNGASEVLSENRIMKTPKDFSIVESIEKLFLDPELLEKEKNNNIRKSKEFSVDKNLSKTLKVINKVYLEGEF